MHQECLLYISDRILGSWELGRSQQWTLAKMSSAIQGCASRNSAKSSGQGLLLLPSTHCQTHLEAVASLMPSSTGKTPITWSEFIPTSHSTWGCPVSTVLEPEAVGLVQPGARTASGGHNSHPNAYWGCRGADWLLRAVCGRAHQA